MERAIFCMAGLGWKPLPLAFAPGIFDRLPF